MHISEQNKIKIRKLAKHCDKFRKEKSQTSKTNVSILQKDQEVILFLI